MTRESHCLELLLSAVQKGSLNAEVPVIIGTEPTLKPMATKAGIPFFVAGEADQTKREVRMLKILQEHNVDLIALARYMRVLSPNFVWRYPNKIINVHPSLLPAFPGASAYEQAFERGARIIGCTAHFVTMDLDEGPIIWQESFKLRPGESLQSIRERGRQLEAKSLLKALRLLMDGKLEVRWGKVFVKP